MKIKIKDLIEYLQEYNPETEVYLDHDGWYEGKATSPREVIDNRGLFSHKPNKQLEYLIINN